MADSFHFNISIISNGKPKTRKIDLTDWNNKDNAEKWREHFATFCNQYLEKAGEQKRVDHRSYKRQEISRATGKV